MPSSKVKVKIKNDTSEMIAEIARRMDVPVKDIQNEFHMYWRDVEMVFNHCLGYGFYVEGFCHFLINMQGVDRITKLIEKTIDKRYKRIEMLKRAEIRQGIKMGERMDATMLDIADHITKIILLNCSIQEYEIEVLSQYPKKYKPQSVYLKRYIKRLEKHYNIPISQFPVQVNHPIQEVFVRSLQRKGLLPNPVAINTNRKV